ncbi:hypothetical protein [Stigmatella hybrida]|uniref:hypothetical protein n=1 Tax=Stigmatella hybrida TaxID=394097 RepID=UPI001CDAF8D1|nr:hypothetical protein [Stigmatella hybrida]
MRKKMTSQSAGIHREVKKSIDGSFKSSPQEMSAVPRVPSGLNQDVLGSPDSARDVVLGLIRERANKQHKAAAIDIGLIVAALVVLALVFVVADRLSQMEMETMVALNGVTDTVGREFKVKDAAERLKVAVDRAGKKLSTPVEAFRDVGEALDVFVRDIHDTESIGRKKDVSTPQLAVHAVTSWMTRIGVLICGFFLIQLLVSKYRFDIRLAGQYDAMADALQLMPEEQELEFDALISALTPKLEFGPIPKVMVNQIAETVRRLSDTVK